jgi:NAD/NADP transhydrogenase alpha subunit
MDALREGMVDKVVDSMHHGVVVDLMRSRGSNYERGQEDYVARRLRYDHKNC